MPSLSPHVKKIWKCDLNLLNMCFRLSIWPNGHRESLKYEFERGTGRTNEAAGPIILLPLFSSNQYFIFTRVAYSVPEVHKLVAQIWYSCRCSCLDRIPPVGSPKSSFKNSQKPNPLKILKVVFWSSKTRFQDICVFRWAVFVRWGASFMLILKRRRGRSARVFFGDPERDRPLACFATRGR
jgi:hypothetical protein